MAKKDKKPKEVKEKRNKEEIDNRLKKIQAMEPPAETPFKIDNENRIDRFWRYRGRNPERLNRREMANQKRR